MANDIKDIIADPSSHYDRPESVIADGKLSKQQKIEVLKQWEYNARALEVAADENMAGDQPSLLSAIRQCLTDIAPETQDDSTAPTRHGG